MPELDIKSSQLSNLDLALNQINRNVIVAYKTITRLQNDINNTMWYHPEFSPAQIVSGLGNRARFYAQFNERLMAGLTAIATQDGIIAATGVPPFDYTKNGNGTLTLVTGQPFNFATK